MPTETPTVFESIFRRQDAIKAHAQTLQCPECRSPQIQIMNQAVQGAAFEWRCRHCRYRFISGKE